MSSSARRTYNRLQLLKVLTKTQFLCSIREHNDCYSLETASWDEYWGGIPEQFEKQLTAFRATWERYIDSGFNATVGRDYADKYYVLLDCISEKENIHSIKMKPFISRILGFENFSLTTGNDNNVFAGATTSFRNPIFLSFFNRGLRRNRRYDSFLLPLLATAHDEKINLFYHYRKQTLITKTDNCVLFYPHVDLHHRPESFHGFEKLKFLFDAEWDSRIEERANIIAYKVLVPFLDYIIPLEKNRSFRILDIGSGVGKYTSHVIGKIIHSGILQTRKFEMTLLDILITDPIEHFDNETIQQGLSKVEYYPCDIGKLDTVKYTLGTLFDMIFLFRIMHNLSYFNILKLSNGLPRVSGSRYALRPYMSNYYRLLSALFPETISTDNDDIREGIYHPVRVFNKDSLLLHDGNSIIEELAYISKSILIEDGDLTPDILVEHITLYVTKNIIVYDLSSYLHLSSNHIFLILSEPMQFHHGTQIWPAS